MKNKHIQQGFTLVEVMIALIIGLFLTAGVIKIFSSTNQTNRVQENLSRMQENARFAMQFLSKDIREAGFKGGICDGGDIIKTAYNNLDSSAASYSFNKPALAGDETFGLNGSDRIVINKLPHLDNGLNLSSDINNLTANMHIDASGANITAAGFKQGSIALITDCSRGDIFQIVNTPTSGTFTHSVGGVTTPGNARNTLSSTYSTTNSKVYHLAKDSGNESIIYDIQNDTATPPVPGLRRNGSQLIANIENMQILYGLKTGDDMQYLPASSLTAVQMEDVVSIKVSILVRSPDDNVATAPQTYSYNGATVTPTDRRLRKVYSSAITIRNRLP